LDSVRMIYSSVFPFNACVFVLDIGLLLLRKFEPDVSSRTKTHQPQQGRAEFRHRQTVVNRRQKNDSQNDRPGKNLKAMKAVAGAVRQNVAEKTFAHPSGRRWGQTLDLLIDLRQTRPAILQLFVQTVSIRHVLRSQGGLRVERVYLRL